MFADQIANYLFSIEIFLFLAFFSDFVKTISNSTSSVQSFPLFHNQHNLKSHSKRLLPDLLFIVIIYPDPHC